MKPLLWIRGLFGDMILLYSTLVSSLRSKPICPRRILLIRRDKLGDFMLTLRAIASVRAAYPDAFIALWCGSSTLGLAKMLPYVDLCASPCGMLQTMWFLLRNRFDTALDFCHGNTTYAAVATTLAGIPSRIGFKGGKRKGGLYTFPVEPQDGLYEEQRTLRIAKSLGVTVVSPTKVQEDLLGVVKSCDLPEEVVGVERICVFSPVSAVPSRTLDMTKAAEFADIIVNQGFAVVFVGLETDNQRIERIRDTMQQKSYSTCGMLSPQQLCALIARSSVFVGVNSGPYQVATLFKRPTVVINGPSCDKRWTIKNGFVEVVTADLPCLGCEARGCPESICPYPYRCMEEVDDGVFLRALMRAVGSDGASSE